MHDEWDKLISVLVDNGEYEHLEDIRCMDDQLFAENWVFTQSTILEFEVNTRRHSR